MFLLIFAVIIAVPLIEIYFVLKIGSVVGVFPTIIMLFAISVFGSIMCNLLGKLIKMTLFSSDYFNFSLNKSSRIS